MTTDADDRTDEQLAAEAQAGSAAAFEVLVRRYQQRLLRFLLRSLRQADAEDVTQDAFVQAYTHLGNYSPRWRFKTWLFVIAQRLMIDRLRRRKGQSDIDSVDLAAADDPSAAVMERERHHQVWSVVRSCVNDEVFQVLWLHYAEDMNTMDIARVLGRSWVWVKTSLHRARHKLAPRLANLNDADRPVLERKLQTCRPTA